MIDQSTLLSLIEKGLDELEYSSVAPRLYEPVRYTLREGGKRLRPLLTLATAQALGGAPEKILPQALAVEMFHNFTLIHDDVMDRSAVRRGRPTVYKKWGEVQAILSGDALLTMATQMVARCDAGHLGAALELFNRTALEIYEGQQLDTEFERRRTVRVSEYIEMIRLKTSVLLGCACSMGALMAGASDEAREAMYDYAVNLGLAFQLRDDWLDTFGDPETFGKAIGGDIVNEKKTWLFLTALGREPEVMRRALEAKTRGAKIRRVTALYTELGLKGECNRLIADYGSRAAGMLARAPMSEDDRAWFAALADNLSIRTK